MSDNLAAKLSKYLPKQEDTRPTDTQDLISRANAQLSCIDLLNKHFGYELEKGGSGSLKLNCVWGYEHLDGGVEKCMRYYWETDRCFCFRDHGVIDAVTLQSYLWNESKARTARQVLESAGLLRREPYYARMPKLLTAAHEEPSMSLPAVQQMFNEQLRLLPVYDKMQYMPDVIALKNTLMQEVEESWNLDEILKWVDESVQKILKKVEEYGSK